jgi:tetratricopeptide (TPR) repeat protein
MTFFNGNHWRINGSQVWLLLLALNLAGCATIEKTADIESNSQSVIMPFAEPLSPVQQLDEDILFHYLVAEVSAQRGELQLAYNHYLHSALLAGDGYAARRATQIAIFLKDQAATLKAANRWVSISPNSIQARNTAFIVNFRAGNEQAALDNLDALIKISQALGRDGFLIAAVSLSKEQDGQAAQALMQKLVSQYQQDEKALYAYAVLLSTQGNYQQVVSTLERVLALKPDWGKPKLLMVKMLIEHRSSEDAIAYLETVMPQHPDDMDLRLVYARLLVGVDQAKAYAEFEKVYRQDPDNSDVIAALGILAVQLEDLALAKKWWLQLLEAGDRERRSEAAFQLGQLEELGGNRQAAETYYLMVNHGKYKIDARVRLARIQAELGKIADARDMLKQLRVLEPEHVVDYYLTEAQILHAHATQEEVFAFYKTAMESNPDDLELLYSRAIFAADQGLVDIAERDLRLIISRKPEHADALNALGYTLANLTDRYAEAFALIKKAYDLKPDSAAILDSMGWVNYRLGNLEQAAEYLQKALNQQNDDEIAAHLGEVLWMMGKKNQARTVWDKALLDFPDSDKLADVIGRFK